MAITIGDEVPEECTKVKHLPLRTLLKDDNNLLQYNGPFTAEPLRHKTPYSVVENTGSPGMDEEFEAGDLIICNTAPHPQAWGTKFYPIGCHVQREEEDDPIPDPNPNNALWIGVITFTRQLVSMAERAFANRGGPTLDNRYAGIPTNLGAIYQWTTDMGDVSWDFIDPPGITHFPINLDDIPGILGPQPWCEVDVGGTLSIKSTWDPDVRDSVGTAKLEGQGRGISFTLDPIVDELFGWPPSNPVLCAGSGAASVFQSGFFHVAVEAGTVLRRHVWNRMVRCTPERLRPVPGTTFPPIIEDPTDPKLPC